MCLQQCLYKNTSVCTIEPLLTLTGVAKREGGSLGAMPAGTWPILQPQATLVVCGLVSGVG